MKKFLLFILFFPAIGFTQDCQLKKTTDPFNHETKISTGFLPFTTGSLKVSLAVDATPSIIDFFLWIKDAGVCFDDQSYAEAIFDGEKSKMRLKNTGSMNCEGAFHFSFKNLEGTNAQLAKIASKKISSIKLTGPNKTETLLQLSEDQKELLMKKAQCLVNEGKVLIKK